MSRLRHRSSVLVVDLSEGDEKALNVALNNPHLAGEFTADIGALLEEIGTADSEAFGDLNFEDLLQDWTLPDSADGKEFDESAADDVKSAELLVNKRGNPPPAGLRNTY